MNVVNKIETGERLFFKRAKLHNSELRFYDQYENVIAIQNIKNGFIFFGEGMVGTIHNSKVKVQFAR